MLLVLNTNVLHAIILTKLVLYYVSPTTSVNSSHGQDSQVLTPANFLERYTIYRNQYLCNVTLCNDNNNVITANNSNSTDTFRETNLGDFGCCSKCSCDDLCERRGDCCPDKLVNFPKPDRYPVGGLFLCIPTSLKLIPYYGQWSANVIGKCSVDYEDLTVAKMCECGVDDDLARLTPVTHKYTKEAYKNIYCAKCNNIGKDDVVAWDINIKCHKRTVMFPKSASQVVSQVRNTDKCNMEFSPPSGYPKPYCNTDDEISQCNSTGEWTNYDPLVEAGCAAYTSNFVGYKNVFCYICNRHQATSFRCYSKKDKWKPEFHKVTFAALFDFKPALTPSANQAKIADCPTGLVFDHYKKVCREIICPDMMEFYNGTCERRIYSVQGFCIEAYIRINPSKIVHSNDKIKEELFVQFHKITDGYKGREIYINLYFASLYDSDIPVWDTKIDYYVIHVMFDDDLDLVDVIAKLDGTSMVVSTFGQTFDAELMVYDLISDKPTFKRLVPYGKLTLHSCQKKQLPLLVTKFIVCPMIHLQVDDFSIIDNGTGLYFTDLNIYLTHRNYLQKNKNEISVCIDDYIPATKEHNVLMQKQNDHSNQISTLSILSLTCVCCSVLCLLLTLIVYVLLPTLRTQPGINNMFLSLSLLLALALFQFGAGQTLDELPCIVMGLAVHFLWLNSIFWTNICCYHMFITFGTTRLSHHNEASLKTTFKYNIYCFLVSCSFIVANIIWSLSRDSVRSVGYGIRNYMCYIKLPYMVAYTIALPAGIVVVTNIMMYVLVVCRISRKRFASTNRNHTNWRYFSVYVKLSSITGMVWLSYIPVYLTTYLIFEIIYTVLLTSQGVFIMLAFICNIRVFKMLKSKLQGKKTKGIGKYLSNSESTRGTIANTISRRVN